MSQLYLEIKYARIVGQSIERWKIKKDNPFHGNGRCPICGDSAQSKTKCRFHISQMDDFLLCKCFNCDYAQGLSNFLKTYHPNLYSEFIFERYRVSGDMNDPIITSPKLDFDESVLIPSKTITDEKFLLDLPLVSDLPVNHPVSKYVYSRHIPEYPFQYAEKFYEFSSQFNGDLLDENGKPLFNRDEPRLIIPFFDRNGNVFAYQGRDLSGKSLQKYITIIINKKIPKIFGIGKVDFKKPVGIVEGPIDSLFLPNCLASVNASLVSTAKKISSVINKDLLTLIYDNEPRNKSIVAMYSEAIKDGFKIVIWPKEVDGIKDINEMSLVGKNPIKIIQKNTYSGLNAQLEFQRWKKV